MNSCKNMNDKQLGPFKQKARFSTITIKILGINTFHFWLHFSCILQGN